MATNRVDATLIIRNGATSSWNTRNPILQLGEFGFEYNLENNTLLLKIGDGVRDWQHLPYLNKYDTEYFQKSIEDGSITFSDEFQQTIAALEAAAGQAIEHLTITDPPVNPTDVPNKQYVDDKVAEAAGLKRQIVEQLPDPSLADENTLYMVLAASGNYYEEYLVVNGAWDMVGETGDGGSGGFTLEVATTARLGGVKADDPTIVGHENTEYLGVTQEGFMTLNKVSTSKLFVPTGDTLVLYGGHA